MKNFCIIFVSLMSLALVVSCQKVIDLDLNSTDPKYVIEGIVTSGETVHQVRITRTLNFDEAAPYPAVENAVVVLSDNAGNIQTLTQVSPGLYETIGFLGVEGRTYTISVSVDGKMFTAQSTIPQKVTLDTLEILGIPFGLDTFKTIVPKYLDPAGTRNYYQFDMYQNSERLDGFYLQDDQFSDGVWNERPIFAGDYSTGDTAKVIMYCIDKPVYKYFFTLDANTGSTAAPANPESNFGKECLGYFTARTQGERSIVVP